MTTSTRSLARLAWRESRGARRRLFLYMSAISVGVAALVAIDSFARNVTRSVAEQSRELLGGDVQFTSRRALPADVRRALDSLRQHGVRTASAITFPSMVLVRRTGGTRLAQVHGVSAGFPLFGQITSSPARAYAAMQSGPNALVDAGLLIATNSHVGDTLSIGYGRFVIAGTLETVPGTSGLASALGPRVYIPERYMPETQLLTFGSTAEYATYLRLPPTIDAETLVRAMRAHLTREEVRARTSKETEATAAKATETLAAFIGIVGLVALLLGGIGVASGVRAFVARKIDTVAILRTLGASANQVLAMYVAQAALMGFAGAALGTLAGLGVQFLLPHAFADVLPVDVHVSLEPAAIITGLVTGVWIALVFALRPLLALRGVSPLQTLRRDADADVLRLRWSDGLRLLVDAALVASVVLVSVLRATSVMQGVALAAGAGAVVLVLAIGASGVSYVARRTLRRGWPYVIRQGVANVYRPGNQTRPVLLSLGFGTFLVATLYLVEGNVVRDLSVSAGSSGGNVLLFDVQGDQGVAVESLITSRGFRVVHRSPIVPMRIAAVNGRSVESIATDSTRGPRRAGWALRREYRATYRDSVTAGEKVTEGQWFTRTSKPFTPSDTGEVSLDVAVAHDLHLRLGDVVTWNVQGVSITTRVTSFREVNWTRFEPNFFAVFPERVLSAAPHQFAMLAAVPGARNVALLQRDIVTRFPNVSSLDLSLVTATIGRIVDKVATAVRFMALFSVLMGIPVLFSAVASTRRERIRESVLLKTLGARRGQVIRILLTEYTLLGALGSLTGLLLAIGGGWALVHFVFHARYAPAIAEATLIALLVTAIAVVIGGIAGRDVFRETAMTALRES